MSTEQSPSDITQFYWELDVEECQQYKATGVAVVVTERKNAVQIFLTTGADYVHVTMLQYIIQYYTVISYS